jgi:hypothetical protein
VKTFIILLFLAAKLQSQVIISEVLYNEPDNRTNLEWVEIYNAADTSIDLGNIIFVANESTTRFSPHTMISPGLYTILASHLTSRDRSEDSFEGHWGDSSGTWGDAFIENFPAFNVNMSLNNSSGHVSISDIFGNQIDSFSWNSPGDDGYSFERDDVKNPQSGWHRCFDPNRSTPGKSNSIPPADGNFSISVNSKIIRLSNSAIDQLQITYSIPSNSKLTIEIYDDSGYRKRRLLDNSSTISDSILWNGHDDNNKSLRPGIYIMLCTVSGAKTGSKSIPVVIAP